MNRRLLHDALNEKFHDKGAPAYLYRLLPGDPIAQGCRLAGLEALAGSVDQSCGSTS
jgi:tRNA 2-thiouridine synthesizing protein E